MVDDPIKKIGVYADRESTMLGGGGIGDHVWAQGGIPVWSCVRRVGAWEQRERLGWRAVMMDKKAPSESTGLTEILPKNGLVYSEKANLSEVRKSKRNADDRSFVEKISLLP